MTVAKKALPHQTSYNGWSWAERCAVTPIQNAAIRRGELIRPTICSICGFSDPANINGSGYIFLHLEQYDKPLVVHPCCKRCHAALHARFRDPERWMRVLRANDRPGEWYMLLTLHPSSQWASFDKTYPNGLPPPTFARRPIQKERSIALAL